MKPYIEAIKPERTFFNVMMTAAGFLFATTTFIFSVNWSLFIYVVLGVALLVASACIANNLIDRELDLAMPRTKKRATATGAVSAKKLTLVATVFGLVGAAILLVHVNVATFFLGALAYVDYVVFYTQSKRTTVWSTLIGTPAGALPLAAGYVALTGSFDWTALLLCLAMVAWQMAHFYGIGLWRLKDYQAGKVPIWPARYGARNTQVWVVGFQLLYIAANVALLPKLGWLLADINIIAGIWWLAHALRGWYKKDTAQWGRKVFGNSLWVLLVFAATLALAPLLN